MCLNRRLLQPAVKASTSAQLASVFQLRLKCKAGNHAAPDSLCWHMLDKAGGAFQNAPLQAT